MKTLSKKDLTNLIIGSTLLSTGGGGSFLSAKKLTGKIKKIPKIKLPWKMERSLFCFATLLITYKETGKNNKEKTEI